MIYIQGPRGPLPPDPPEPTPHRAAVSSPELGPVLRETPVTPTLTPRKLLRALVCGRWGVVGW